MKFKKKHILIFVLLLFALPAQAHLAASQLPDVENPTIFRNGKLFVSANIFDGDEDERKQPLAARFYIFRRSFVSFLKEKDFEPVDENDNLLTTEEAFLEAVAYTLTTDAEEGVLLSLLINDVIVKNRISVITTDSQGFGKSGNLKKGNYYLFGYAQSGNEIFVWNIPVKISGGQKHLEIDQYNADTVIDSETRETARELWQPRL